MAGSISLNSVLGGTVVITAADSVNTNYLTIPAANGIAVHSVANTGYGYAANTGATIIASGNTAQRPSSAANGSIRYNTSNNWIEFYNGTGWNSVGTAVAASILVIGGGGNGAGGASSDRAGGGGAGGFVTANNFAVQKGITYTVIVGAGGGNPSSFGGLIGALGGGSGGSNGCLLYTSDAADE